MDVILLRYGLWLNEYNNKTECRNFLVVYFTCIAGMTCFLPFILAPIVAILDRKSEFVPIYVEIVFGSLFLL